MVQVLLEGGSRPNLGRRVNGTHVDPFVTVVYIVRYMSQRNTTALYMAAERGLPSIVRMLLRAGADPSLNIPVRVFCRLGRIVSIDCTQCTDCSTPKIIFSVRHININPGVP